MKKIGEIYKPYSTHLPTFWCNDHRSKTYPYKPGACSWHGGIDYGYNNALAAQRAYKKRMMRLKQMNGIGQDIFSADQIVGKTLIAKSNVPLKRYAQAAAPVVYTAKKGEVVGVVYSWVMDGPTLYWQFLDKNGNPYYAQHRTGIFSVDALQQQGAQTLEDIKEAADQADNPITTTVERILKPVALAAAAFFIIKAFK